MDVFACAEYKKRDLLYMVYNELLYFILDIMFFIHCSICSIQKYLKIH